jgi:hypothetical protein
MPVTRRSLLATLTKTWWLTLYGLWGLLGAVDLGVTHYGSPAAKEKWDSYWVISRPSHLIITLLVFTIVFLFERAYQEIKKATKDEKAEFRAKLHVVAGCSAAADEILTRAPHEGASDDACSKWNAEVDSWVQKTYEKLNTLVGMTAATQFNTNYTVKKESYPGYAPSCAFAMQVLNFRKRQLEEITKQSSVFIPT